jgi:uncharacterized protein (DUF1684 family)
MKYLGFLFFFATIISACSNMSNNHDQVYLDSVADWKAKRDSALRDPSGWLSLSGLFWLQPGKNTFGSANDNQLVFPEKFPDYCGTFTLTDRSVSIQINEGVPITGAANNSLLASDKTGAPTIVNYQTANFYIIERGDAIGIRMKDSLNPPLVNFEGMDYFPVDPKYALKATFEPYPQPKVSTLINVFGMEEEVTVLGKLAFEWEGKTYRLDAIDDGSEPFFVIFADQTSAVETYGGGRYMYIDRPVEGSSTVDLDFNKAYNPPCVFTEFATCLLPTPENKLLFMVKAGELTYGNH